MNHLNNPVCKQRMDYRQKMPRHLLEYLEQTAAAYPNAPAYCSEQERFCWREVERLAKQIGCFLLSFLEKSGKPFHSPSKQPFIALFMEKAPHTVLAMLGSLYAGGYYTVLNPALAEAGKSPLAELLRFLKPDILLYDATWATQTEQLFSKETTLSEELPSLCLDTCLDNCLQKSAVSVSTAFSEQASFLEAVSLYDIRRAASPSDTICLTVTSSSSGQPKCVETSHLSVIRYIDALADILQTDETTVFGNQAPFCFDACMKELFVSMKCGGSAWMIPSELFSKPEDLIGYLNRHQINTICWVSSAYSLAAATDAFASLRPEFLRTAAFGSEVLPPSVLAYWQSALPEVSFFNLYGPTEATGMSCYYPVPRHAAASSQQETPHPEISEQETSWAAEPIPIGRPFPGVEIYLLGENGQPVPDGEPGELYIKSNRLAKGYYRQEELTKQVFFAQAPFADSTSTSSTSEAGLPSEMASTYPFSEMASPYSFYRTGDLAKRLPSRDLVFLGRKDFQVKRMGYRIDLVELERLAMACPQVKSCCCVQKPDGRIVLYVLQHTDAPLPAATGSVHAPHSAAALTSRISALLRQSLPSYALPNRIILRKSFPFLPNGKIDRRRLKEE